MKISWLVGLSLVSATLVTTPCRAIDSFSLEAAGGDHIGMLRAAAQWNWEQRWWQSGTHHLGGYWNLSIANWTATRYHGIPNKHENIANVGFTPVLRYGRNDRRGWYGELGIGLHLLSDKYDNDNRKLSTHFQFGDHVGIGYVFSNSTDLGFAVQHFSNGSIKRPNSGVDFLVLKVAFPY